MAAPNAILYTIPNFITAGSGRAMLNIIERLDRDRFEPAVCVLRRGGDLEKILASWQVPIFEAGFTVKALPHATLPFRVFSAARLFRAHQRILWHSYHYSDDYTEALVCRTAGTPVWMYTKKNMSWGSRAWRLRTRFASGIAAMNSSMIDMFFSDCRSKVRYIPPGVDANMFCPGEPSQEFRPSLPTGKEPFVLAHIAQFVPVKNHQLLLHALALCDPSVCLLCAGSFMDEAYTAGMRQLAKELGLGNRVFFLGRIPDVAQLLRSADAFVFSSLMEGLPVAGLEAMATGLPSVVTDIPAMKDVHQSGRTGFVVPAGDANAFAEAIEHLRRNEDLRRSMGEQARKRVLAEFTLEEEARKYQEFYSALLCR